MVQDYIIDGLSILLSSKCNLNCDFCFLNKNKTFNEYDQIILSAWENQTYIQNLINTLLKMNQHPTNIHDITFWGGETLYNIDIITKNISLLCENFPNVNNYWLSTNFTMNIEQLVLFLQELDKNSKQKACFKLQLSIDGPYEIAGHKVSNEIYEKNLKKFFSLINDISFKNLSIILMINSVIDGQLFLSYFSDSQHIITYMDYMHNLCKIIKNYNKNSQVLFDIDMILPRLSRPSIMTQEDGILFSNILSSWYNIIKNNFTYLNPNMILAIISKSEYRYKESLSLLKGNHNCIMLYNNLCILPDGTIAECINQYMLCNKQYQEELKENNLDEYYISKMSEKLSFNPNQMDTQKLTKQLYFINNGFKTNISTYRCLALGLGQELAASNQISYIYKNPEILYAHIAMLEQDMDCSAFNLRANKNSFLHSTSEFRKLFNGAALQIFNIKKDLIYEQ